MIQSQEIKNGGGQSLSVMDVGTPLGKNSCLFKGTKVQYITDKIFNCSIVACM